jgi:nucleoside-diphosphate-sugar epimerase
VIGICGASGFIGWDLFQLLKTKDDVLGTYCEHPRDGLIKFDIVSDSFEIFDSCKCVILTLICGGLGGVFKQESPNEELCRLSYLKTKSLLEYLDKKNINTIFISSKGIETTNNFYTKYKLDIENFITNKLKHSQFIRPDRIDIDNVCKLNEEIYQMII